MRQTLALLIVTCAALLPACAKKKDKGRVVSGNASVFMGPTNGGVSALTQYQPTEGLPSGSVILSPAKSKITIKSIRLEGEPDGDDMADEMNIDLVNCTITVDFSLSSAAKLLDCPAEAPEGTYSGMNVILTPEAEVLIDEPAIGIYSDANSSTLLSATKPSGGAQFVPLARTGGTTIVVNFPTDVTISDGFSLQLIASAIHTVYGDIRNGVPSLDGSHMKGPPARLVAMPGTVGKMAFYSSGSADSYRDDGDAPTEVLLFYASAREPIMAEMVDYGGSKCFNQGGTYNSAYAQTPGGSRLGGYLGLDANGDLGWALPVDASFSTYVSTMVMHEATTMGETTKLKCKNASTAPAPTSGATYASGVPTDVRDTPDEEIELKLVAD